MKNKTALKGGTYSIVLTTIVLAILVVVNIFAQALPSSVTQYDISSTKLYSITSNTKVVVNALEEDVTIYWVVQNGKEDDVIEKLLDKYDTLSDHIKIKKKNPDIYPTFTKKYTSDEVANNSLIVECGDRNRYIAYSDIYVTSGSAYSGYSGTTSFDGEGAITSAIDYVVNSEQSKMYILNGHGEAELSTTFSNQLTKENIETEEFSLLTTNEVPDDADFVLINAPSSDISEEEKNMLENYFDNGGKLLVMAGPVESGDLPNLYSLLSDYGVKSDNGVVVDTDHDHYAFQAPYILMPTIESSDITDPLLDENYYAIVPIARGLEVGNTDKDVNVTSLLTTSDEAYSKVAGYNLTTYDKEDGDTDGPFTLGVDITQDENDGQMIWYASSYLVDDTYNSYSSGANLDLVMNSISSLVGQRDAVSIRSKSLQYNYLTISDSTSSILKLVMIGVFPIVYLAVGIAIVVKRRRANEAN